MKRSLGSWRRLEHGTRGHPIQLVGRVPERAALSPAGPTCGHKCYDFFLVSTSLTHACAGTQGITDIGGRPHRASRLLIAGCAGRAMVKRMMELRAITTHLRPTAPMKPPCYDEVIKGRPDWQISDEVFRIWYDKVDEEFTHLSGVDARPNDSPLRKVQTCALQMGSGGQEWHRGQTRVHTLLERAESCFYRVPCPCQTQG